MQCAKHTKQCQPLIFINFERLSHGRNSVSALARNFKISESDIDGAKQSGMDQNADSKAAKSLSYSPPPDPLRILSADNINYKVSATETNRKIMEKALIKKYRIPTIIYAPRSMEWRSKPTEEPWNDCFKEAR